MYQFRSDSGLPQRGHVPRCRRAVRTANHSSFSLRRSSACRRSLGCKAWMVQVVPSSSPRQTRSTPLKICRLTALRGASRHNVSFPGRLAGRSRGRVSRSGVMSTCLRPFLICDAGLCTVRQRSLDRVERLRNGALHRRPQRRAQLGDEVVRQASWAALSGS